MFEFTKLPSWARALPPVALAEAASGLVDRNRGTIHDIAERTGLAGEDYTIPQGAFVGPYPGGGIVPDVPRAEAPGRTLSLAEAAAAVGAAAAPAARVPTFRGESQFDPTGIPEWGGVDGLRTRAQMQTDLGARRQIGAEHERALADIAAREKRDDPMAKMIGAREQTLDYERLLPHGSRSRLQFAVPKPDGSGMTDLMEPGYGHGDALRGFSAREGNTLRAAVDKEMAGQIDPKSQLEAQRRRDVEKEAYLMERAIQNGADPEEAMRIFALRVQALSGLSLSEVLDKGDEITINTGGAPATREEGR